MKDTLKLVGRSVSSLIGPNAPFKSARELARKAQTLGYVERADSFAKSILRAATGEHDSQISTVQIIARTAGVKAEDIFAGVSFAEGEVNLTISNDERPLSIESHKNAHARLFNESIAGVSKEMRVIIDELAEADRSGGPRRDILLGSIGAMLLTTREHAKRKTK